MGELRSGDGHTGPRCAHPGDSEPVAGLEALLAAALRVDHVDAEAEQRAVHAFRAAREAGAHRARTRRRDDWRPRGRRGARSLRTTLSVLLACFTLGGVAFAAIGGVDSASQGARDEPRPAGSSADARPGQQDPGSAAVSVSPSASAGPDRPGTARDTESHCRAYEKVKGHGKSLEATAWRWLVDAAGGEKKVDGYCERNRGGAEGGEKHPGGGGTAEPAVPDIPADPTVPHIPADPTVPDAPADPAVPDISAPAATHAPADPNAESPATPTAPGRGDATEDLVDPGATRPDPDGARATSE